MTGFRGERPAQADRPGGAMAQEIRQNLDCKDNSLAAGLQPFSNAPQGFDPKRFPVIARHFFGVFPPETEAVAAIARLDADVLAALDGDRMPPAPLRAVST